jgi:hypothetical protein
VKAQGLTELPTCPVGSTCAPRGWACCDYDAGGLIEYPYELEWQEKTEGFPIKRCTGKCEQPRPWMCVFWPVMPVAWRREPDDYSEWAVHLTLQCELLMLDPKSCAWHIDLASECGRLLVEQYPELIAPFMKRQWEEFSPARSLGFVARPEVLHSIVVDPMAPRLMRTLVQFSQCQGGCLNLKAHGLKPLFKGKNPVKFVKARGPKGPYMTLPWDEGDA